MHGCGHTFEDHGPDGCRGTLASIGDSDYAAWMIRDGADPNEQCACMATREQAESEGEG